ncbi:CPBP family intramembrane metalloprotease [Microbispora sp. RL4-1S]|uniref:CPBP family intramembrane metalloprotease n=1 Tax=Microbispora oryzae TaxID=2806554 RepID=A0A940WL35_9ACTN|nr:type II CAAX endopeptidase family protein [Microbispora oryzae]MBP2707644.1 CPBP family intramembrane metalloprotease [Microbispora oryzae]
MSEPQPDPPPSSAEPPPGVGASGQWPRGRHPARPGPYDGGPFSGQYGRYPPPYGWEPPRPRPWSAPPAPGSRYDRLADTPYHRWWRPIVGTALIIVGFLVMSTGIGLIAGVVSILLGTPMSARGSRLFEDPLLDLGFHLGVIALALPLVFVAALAIRRRPGALSSVVFHLRWKWLGVCLLVALAAVVLGQLAEAATLLGTGADPGYRWAGWDAFLPPMILILVLVPFQSAAEEYAFRGWIIQSFGAYLRTPWPGILIGSAAFASLHGYTDWGIAYVFGFGILMGWLAILTGGLEAPIALHATNNLMAFGLVAASGETGSALEQGSLPWQSLVGTAVQFAVYGVAIIIIARKATIQTLSR